MFHAWLLRSIEIGAPVDEKREPDVIRLVPLPVFDGVLLASGVDDIEAALLEQRRVRGVAATAVAGPLVVAVVVAELIGNVDVGDEVVVIVAVVARGPELPGRRVADLGSGRLAAER